MDTSSPPRRRTARRVAVAAVVIPAVMFGLLVLSVFAGPTGATLSLLAGVALLASGIASRVASPSARRVAREALAALCAPLSGFAAFAGAMLVGLGVGAMGIMEPGSAEDQWAALSIFASLAAGGLAWWLTRRELIPR